jgi:hypothetical protein
MNRNRSLGRRWSLENAQQTDESRRSFRLAPAGNSHSVIADQARNGRK